VAHPKPPSTEVSDEIVSFDGQGGRNPISREQLIQSYLQAGNKAAAKIVSRIPVDSNGHLLDSAVDRLLIGVHAEMQRMHEEFHHGERVSRRLRVVLEQLDRTHWPRPWTIADIGCGPGYVLRYLAASGNLPDDVELIGYDLNAALVGEANRLADREGLSARFVTGDALTAPVPATVYMSTGVLHHFRNGDLQRFLQRQVDRRPAACIHWDFQPGLMRLVGGWVFHMLRMRHPLSIHDGMASLARMHTGETLLESGSTGNYSWEIGSRNLWGLPIRRVFHLLIGLHESVVR
jgi:SAM-dependent methyltransferase